MYQIGIHQFEFSHKMKRLNKILLGFLQNDIWDQKKRFFKVFDQHMICIVNFSHKKFED